MSVSKASPMAFAVVVPSPVFMTSWSPRNSSLRARRNCSTSFKDTPSCALMGGLPTPLLPWVVSSRIVALGRLRQSGIQGSPLFNFPVAPGTSATADYLCPSITWSMIHIRRLLPPSIGPFCKRSTTCSCRAIHSCPSTSASASCLSTAASSKATFISRTTVHFGKAHHSPLYPHTVKSEFRGTSSTFPSTKV
ncbi:hypothetical protein BCR44DRAFT_1425012 [Catenaria anguillulae PL171]|uniref:Uncharacterized protein n=1 Tax=Catenaria anguillulae PL171 TaxID=765915 RepID=A0A1Y2I0N8_9FUNG|nr:hypothetical protein BCR44DRAFT_1425012 [Catenaria anguillulae PL171]